MQLRVGRSVYTAPSPVARQFNEAQKSLCNLNLKLRSKKILASNLKHDKTLSIILKRIILVTVFDPQDRRGAVAAPRPRPAGAAPRPRVAAARYHDRRVRNHGHGHGALAGTETTCHGGLPRVGCV